MVSFKRGPERDEHGGLFRGDGIVRAFEQEGARQQLFEHARRVSIVCSQGCGGRGIRRRGVDGVHLRGRGRRDNGSRAAESVAAHAVRIRAKRVRMMMVNFFMYCLLDFLSSLRDGVRPSKQSLHSVEIASLRSQ